MNIGFDAKRFFLNRTGLGNYSRSTLSLLHEFHPEHDYHLYTPKQGDPGASVPCLPDLKVHLPPPPLRAAGRLWRTALLSRDLVRDGMDIFHGLSHELPLGIGKTKIRTVVTMHDLIFMRYPKLYGPANARIYAAKYRRSCREADLVIAISEQTARDVQEFFGISGKKIRVVYQTCDAAFGRPSPPGERQRLRDAYDLPEQYVLYVGSLIERKNCLNLLRAMARVPGSRRIPLLLVGRGGRYRDLLVRAGRDLGIEHLVRFLDTVPFRDLPGLYRQASLFVYPSRFEGFGIPILEALSCSTPVITSTGSCFSEVGGDGALYIDPDRPDLLAEAMLRVLSDKELRASLRTGAGEQIKRFSGRAVAADLMRVYRELCS
ncbi:MAG TPA: glycosyltransferase family 1 protein [Desulfomicrobiaceae bacterium]|nr:glycosyltransferase family 1 protein [Desulfomicrobiaceae bacterium]